jgi:hypothetical protein
MAPALPTSSALVNLTVRVLEECAKYLFGTFIKFGA